MDANNDHIDRHRTYICSCGQGFVANQFSIQCDHCKEWFHGHCVQLHEVEAEEVDKFYCRSCQQSNPGLVTIRKQVTNDWRHNRTEAMPEGKPVQAGTARFIHDLKNKTFKDARSEPTVIRRMRGQQLTFKELFLNGFKVPILVESMDGLELWVPSNSFNAKKLLDYYSSDHVLDVIDVRRQLNIKMKIQEFVDRLSVPPENRPDIYNCISLEVSNNSLSNSVRPPSIVTKLSWVDNYWPDIDSKPQVSKYCLISMKDSYTDFHVDFGGTSVWYHILSGEKQFYIIKPTQENLDHYEKWMAMDNTSDHFLADITGVDECYRLSLSAGQTLFIPTGWIHAVLTPQDSVVFGGNFLHSLNIELQLKIREMEQRMKTPFKFQFPFFELTHWYAAANVLKQLEDNLKNKPPKHLVDGVAALIPALKQWLKKSKDYQNQNEFQISSFTPKGFNCFKIIKDLNSSHKKAVRRLDGQPMVKKRGKSYKEFDLKNNEEEISSLNIIESLPEGQIPGKDDSDIKDQTLVIDDSVKAPKIRSLSTDSTESKGNLNLKVKLNISGAKEILGTNKSDDNSSKDISHETKLHLSPKIGSENNSQSPKGQKNKRKKEANDDQEDEFERMAKRLPQDGDYIYLDIETPGDEDASTRSKAAPKDEAWAPKARVTVKGIPKAPRQPRDEAKRAVVETTIANAAARMETEPKPKRQLTKKKEKPKVSVRKEPSTDSHDSAASSLSQTKVSSSSATSVAALGSVTAASNPNPNPQTNPNRTANKPKKGYQTAKQRLHKKIMSQKKRGHF